MQRVLDRIDDESLAVHVVWIYAIRSDDYEAAIESRKLISDSRAKHYWDGDRTLGYALSPVLGTQMKMAWDVYLAYDRGVVWDGPVPPPSDWLHQKRTEAPMRYLDEAKLEAMIRNVLK